jgi:hypothetical protein
MGQFTRVDVNNGSVHLRGHAEEDNGVMLSHIFKRQLLLTIEQTGRPGSDETSVYFSKESDAWWAAWNAHLQSRGLLHVDKQKATLEKLAAKMITERSAKLAAKMSAERSAINTKQKMPDSPTSIVSDADIDAHAQKAALSLEPAPSLAANTHDALVVSSGNVPIGTAHGVSKTGESVRSLKPEQLRFATDAPKATVVGHDALTIDDDAPTTRDRSPTIGVNALVICDDASATTKLNSLAAAQRDLDEAEAAVPLAEARAVEAKAAVLLAQARLAELPDSQKPAVRSRKLKQSELKAPAARSNEFTPTEPAALKPPAARQPNAYAARSPKAGKRKLETDPPPTSLEPNALTEAEPLKTEKMVKKPALFVSPPPGFEPIGPQPSVPRDLDPDADSYKPDLSGELAAMRCSISCMAKRISELTSRISALTHGAECGRPLHRRPSRSSVAKKHAR